MRMNLHHIRSPNSLRTCFFHHSWHKKVYICDKLTSFVNDVKCGNETVSEFMNEVNDINDMSIFDLLCLGFLVLKHHRLPYTCR